MSNWLINATKKWLIDPTTNKWKIGTTGDPCCFAQAVKCSDGSASAFWMNAQQASAFQAFKFNNTCYRFGGLVAPCPTPGSILLQPGNVQAYNSCTQCAGSTGGVPCAQCSGQGTPRLWRAVITGSGNCGCVAGSGGASWSKIDAGFDGNYDVPQIPGNPCSYSKQVSGTITQRTYTGGGCVTPFSVDDVGWGIDVYVGGILNNHPGKLSVVIGFRSGFAGSFGVTDAVVACDEPKSFSFTCVDSSGMPTPFGGFTIALVPIF